MRNLRTLRQRLFQSAPLGWSISFLLSLGLTTSLASAVRAESPETAPAELKQVLSQIEAAANRRDVEDVMQFYSPNFTNSDGLGRDSLSTALTQLWERYPQLSYRIELQSWDTEGDEIVAETITYISGTQPRDEKETTFESTLRSRQYLEDQKVFNQEILAERTQLSMGSNPPQVEVNLPEQVQTGEPFNFDVIVKKPLEEDLLLGAALEEQVSRDLYLNPTEFELELLPAGGIFKVGRAPLLPDNQWVSAILVREGGITMVTQRLRVVDKSSANR